MPNTLSADPCGMVPPIYTGTGVPIVRTGIQKTYVFHKEGIATLVIRPGFQGKVDEFGMLIPFPSVPAIRKVPDNIFAHIAAAIDPQEVVFYAQQFPGFAFGGGLGGATGAPAPAAGAPMEIRRKTVRVIKEEAVGMYEVAVLQAGSAAALQRWMTAHGFRYPEGMDAACEDYVDEGWCFVAVKTKVGRKEGVDPKPGMRKVDSKMPAGSTFDGHVQAMGFRFRSKELEIPMRLSTFNEGELRNVVYLLSDTPQRIRGVPSEYVVRQISGGQLYQNVTAPRPLRLLGGTVAQISKTRRVELRKLRDPVPHNGNARDLFASDLMTVQNSRLTHPYEEDEKMLLRIGERLDLRGPEIDTLNEGSLKEKREAIVKKALADLKSMTLTVIDGNFPRETLSKQNLKFAAYRMPRLRNTPNRYDATTRQRRSKRNLGGRRILGPVSAIEPVSKPSKSVAQDAVERKPFSSRISYFWATTLFAGLLTGLVLSTRRRGP